MDTSSFRQKINSIEYSETHESQKRTTVEDQEPKYNENDETQVFDMTREKAYRT